MTMRASTARVMTRALAGAAALAAILAQSAAPAHAAPPVATTCTYVVSTTGSDANLGSLSAPLRTAAAGASRLAPGVTVCFRAGTYDLPVTTGDLKVLTLTRGGSTTARATLRPYPGEDATLVGRLVIQPSAASLMIAGLALNGTSTLQSEASAVTVWANDVSLVGNDITAPTRICVGVGEYGATTIRVSGFLAEGNRIHHCGDNRTLGVPYAGYSHNQEHALYLGNTTGAVVEYNLIDHADARGVQLFSNADGSRIRYNTLDANTVGFNLGGSSAGTSEANTLSGNLVTGLGRVGVDVNWAAGIPTGTNRSTVTTSCFFGPSTSTMLPSTSGLVVSGNRWVDPAYVNQATGDYRLQSTSPCLGVGLRPSLTAGSVSSAGGAITAGAKLSPHRQSATYALRVRTCSTSDCVGGTLGPWIWSADATALSTLDVPVSRSVAGLTPGRAYQVQWTARQALLPRNATSALVVTSAQVVTAR